MMILLGCSKLAVKSLGEASTTGRDRSSLRGFRRSRAYRRSWRPPHEEMPATERTHHVVYAAVGQRPPAARTTDLRNTSVRSATLMTIHWPNPSTNCTKLS